MYRVNFILDLDYKSFYIQNKSIDRLLLKSDSLLEKKNWARTAGESVISVTKPFVTLILYFKIRN